MISPVSQQIAKQASPVRPSMAPNYDATDILALTGYRTRSAVWKAEAAGRFPRRIKIGDGRNGRVVWDRAEVDAWLASRRTAA